MRRLPIEGSGLLVTRTLRRPRVLVKALLRSTSTQLLQVMGTDVTSELTRRSTVVIAPHPDDETLGCGATVARMRHASTKVSVVIVANGGRAPRPPWMDQAELVRRRRAEAIAALALLGVAEQDVAFLDFEDGSLSARSDAVMTQLAAIVAQADADQVFVTSALDRHPDHAALGRAVRRLFESSVVNGQLFEYPIWQRVPAWSLMVGILRGSGWRRALQQRPRLVSTDGFLRVKRDAVGSYVTQLGVLPVGFVDDFLQSVEVFVPFEPSAGRVGGDSAPTSDPAASRGVGSPPGCTS